MLGLFINYFQKIAFLSLLLLGVQGICFSQSLKGKVDDAVTGESLVGANVLVRQTNQKTFVELDGYFRIRELKPGTYTIVISYTGYATKEETVRISTTNSQTQVFQMSSAAKNLEEAAVTTDKRETGARKLEKNAAQLVNVVSARAIELSPDIAVGNVVQRVSGVSVQRSSSGDGRYAIIRGLDSRYNYTSVGGVILPSPDPTQRAVPLDMFPADMVQRIEIVKSLTPDMEANAIGGATNLVMKEGSNKFSLSADLSVGGSSVFTKRSFSQTGRGAIDFQSPTEMHGSNYAAKPSDIPVTPLNFHRVQYPVNMIAGLTISDRIFKRKLGYSIGASYIREYRGGNTLYYLQNGVNNNPPNSPIFSQSEHRQYSFLQSRLGLQGKLSYELSANHGIDLYGLFLQLDNNQHSHYDITPFAPGEIDYYDRFVFDRKNMTHLALHGHDKFSKRFSGDWTLSYANARSTTPNQLDLFTYKEVTYYPNYSPLYVNNLPSVWQHSNDRDKSAYLNLGYDAAKHIAITAGGLFRHKDRTSYYNDYTEISNTGNANDPLQPYTAIGNANFTFLNPYGDTTNENNYTAHENISAGYLQAKILFAQKLQVIGGVRAEHTSQHYTSMISSALVGKTGDFNYTDILPGLHLRYGLTDKQNLRLSYFASISRPNLYDLIPAANNTDLTSLYITSGNYNLKHSTASNIDFRYDNFFSSTDYIMVGLFYKQINNPIEFGTFTLDGTATTVSNSTSILYGPTNPGSDATNYGFELVASKFIGKFGLSGNYSYTHSSITTTKELSGTTNGYPTNTFVKQTRPLQGQADHIGNLSLLFKDTRSGWDAQLSFVYTGKRIAVVSPFYGLDIWQRAGTQLDLSVTKRFNSRFSVFFKATNLLNNSLFQEIPHANGLISYPGGLEGQTDPKHILIQRDAYGQTVLGGIKYKL
ncbi:MAG TPA: TonB-dependent receptor [Puia sp.]|jgi:outer membrane receptor for ferrienterochelin and colicin